MSNIQELSNIASQVRRDIIRMVTAAQSGHPGGSLSSTDIMTALFFSEMKHSPAQWERSGKGNDMFFLSAGHISPVFYSVLARSGYFPVSELAHWDMETNGWVLEHGKIEILVGSASNDIRQTIKTEI